jgi:hypothetical protein
MSSCSDGLSGAPAGEFAGCGAPRTSDAMHRAGEPGEPARGPTTSRRSRPIRRARVAAPGAAGKLVYQIFTLPGQKEDDDLLDPGIVMTDPLPGWPRARGVRRTRDSSSRLLLGAILRTHPGRERSARVSSGVTILARLAAPEHRPTPDLDVRFTRSGCVSVAAVLSEEYWHLRDLGSTNGRRGARITGARAGQGDISGSGHGGGAGTRSGMRGGRQTERLEGIWRREARKDGRRRTEGRDGKFEEEDGRTEGRTSGGSPDHRAASRPRFAGTPRGSGSNIRKTHPAVARCSASWPWRRWRVAVAAGRQRRDHAQRLAYSQGGRVFYTVGAMQIDDGCAPRSIPREDSRLRDLLAERARSGSGGAARRETTSIFRQRRSRRGDPRRRRDRGRQSQRSCRPRRDRRRETSARPASRGAPPRATAWS